MDKLEELKNELIEKAEKVGTLTERNRILRGLNEIDLPLGVWPLIKDIINPK